MPGQVVYYLKCVKVQAHMSYSQSRSASVLAWSSSKAGRALV